MAALRSGLAATVPVMVMLGIWEISKIKSSDKWLKLVLVFVIIEFIISWVFYSWGIDFIEKIATTGGKNLSNKPLTEVVSIAKYEELFSAYKFFGLHND
jgi:cell division septal protein FtsQ